MSFIFKTILASFWMVILPGCIGVLFLRTKEKITWAESFLVGWLFIMALTELLTLPMILWDLPLKILTISLGGILLIVGAVGLLESIQNRWMFRESGIVLKQASIWFWIAAVMILIQIVYATAFAHFDADDSFYVGVAVTDVSTNTIFSISPYTGMPYTVPPARYVLSPYPVLLAVISNLSGGLHPATVAHCFYPAVFMILSYLVLYMIARTLFPNNSDSHGRFLLFASVFVWFSAYSVYNRENFLMIRIWQGKATLAAVLLPTLFYLGINRLQKKEQQYPWIVVLLAAVSCCLTSTLGVILAPILIAVSGSVSAVMKRNPRIFLYSLLCCIPNLILGVLYAVIR